MVDSHYRKDTAPTLLHYCISLIVGVGIVGGWGWTPSLCLQTLIFEWKSALNFNLWAKFQTFRQLTPQFFRSIPPLLIVIILSSSTFLSAANETVSQVSDADFDKLMNYDDKCFVRPGSAWRREFISRWIKIPGGRALVAVNHRGDVIGYGCRNPDAIRNKVHFIAPLYADSYEVAWDLIHELSRDVVGQTIVIHLT